MLHDKDGGRIRLKRFCAVEEKEVPYEHIVKGYEVSQGRLRHVDAGGARRGRPEGHARPSRSTTSSSSPRSTPSTTSDLLPRPGEERGARRTRCSSRRCGETGKVAIATFVLRTRESLCCLRPLERRARALDHEPRRRGDPPTPRSSSVAGEAVRRASCRWRSSSSGRSPRRSSRSSTRDVHRERVLELVERKAEGETIEAPETGGAARRGGEPRRRALREPRGRAAARRRGGGGKRARPAPRARRAAPPPPRRPRARAEAEARDEKEWRVASREERVEVEVDGAPPRPQEPRQGLLPGAQGSPRATSSTTTRGSRRCCCRTSRAGRSR